MSRALSSIKDDLIRALGRLNERPAVDQAVRERAERLARAIEESAGTEPVTASVSRRGAADYRVAVSGPGLFGREFGPRETEAEPVIAAAIGRVTRPAP